MCISLNNVSRHLIIQRQLLPAYNSPCSTREDCGREEDSERDAEQDGPPGVGEVDNGVGAAVAAAEMGCACNLIKSNKKRTALKVTAHVVAQICVLAHVGVELGLCALDAEPFLVLEDAECGGVGLYENE